MAHGNKVLRSINTPDGGRCVDVFQRPDGTFGFEEFRRDVEDLSGWFAIGGYANRTFDSQQDVFDLARASVSWLGDSDGPGQA